VSLSELSAAAGLLTSAASTFLLARSFTRIGADDLWEIGAGGIWEGDYSIFGARWRLVQSACRQKADTLWGLVTLASGMVLQIAGVVLGQASTSIRVNPLVAMVVATAFGGFFLVVASACSRRGAVSLLQNKIRELVLSPSYSGLRRKVRSHEGQAGLQREVENLLGNLSNRKQIGRFTANLLDEIQNLESTEA